MVINCPITPFAEDEPLADDDGDDDAEEDGSAVYVVMEVTDALSDGTFS